MVVLTRKQEGTVGTEVEVPSGESPGQPRVPSTERPQSRSEQCVLRALLAGRTYASLMVMAAFQV